MSVFASFRNVPLVNQSTSNDDLAAELMRETCETLKALKVDAMAAEQACEQPLPPSLQQRECYETIEALLKGRHRPVVLPVLLESFPELVRPATEMEKAACEQVLAERDALKSN